MLARAISRSSGLCSAQRELACAAAEVSALPRVGCGQLWQQRRGGAALAFYATIQVRESAEARHLEREAKAALDFMAASAEVAKGTRVEQVEKLSTPMPLAAKVMESAKNLQVAFFWEYRGG
eukprot:TRINITY_DN5583_c0_g1_i5.p1 TRINITY_DN5583_c0_g1~~TRINITY_DN5583_c0_g1_i5.p1  ORF type:complete len:122 (+),score=25.30 TRINITY_DN5583_c0_g1_i5:89-454(+)